MIEMNRFGIINIDQFVFLLPTNSSYIEFNNPVNGKTIHVYFRVSETENHFTITSINEPQRPQELAEQVYAINLYHSVPAWCTPPRQMEGTQSEVWACGFGLKKGEGLRIYKVFFEGTENSVCLTFSAPSNTYKTGFEVFQKIARSFRVVSENSNSEIVENQGID